MDRSNVVKYLLSVVPVKTMFNMGLLAKQEYNQAEHYLAEKYCIKKGNLYRLIDLTIPSSRVIDRVSFKEVKDEEENHKYKHITKVSKES
ncbi:MAG: hypothetical protein CVV56_08620 [Tenericutes bacterium HGW-Tenericutes-1]|jgi:hypothetical protein|nr:MAG: hypothetical protein CVV56_08620 [Tenericutes bacterium HGW-Tenericutes-1]